MSPQPPPSCRPEPIIPALLCTHDLPSEELQAARLDGELFGLYGSFAPMDSVPGTAHRAESLPPLLNSPLIAELETAAWIHGALVAPPDAPPFCLDTKDNVRAQRYRGLPVRQVVIASHEWQRLGRCRVTTPLRTLIDLARLRGDETVADTLRFLSLLAEVNWPELRAKLHARHHLRDKNRLLSTLDHALGSGEPAPGREPL